MDKLWSYFRPYKGRMALGLTIKFVGSMMDLILPYLLAEMVDDIVPSGRERDIFLCGALMALCAAVAVSFNVIANRMAAKVSMFVTGEIRHDLFSKITVLSSRGTDAFTVPSLVSRLTSDTYNVHRMIDRVQRGGVRAPLLTLGGLAVTFTLDKTLALVLLAIIPLIALVVLTVTKAGIPLYSAAQRETDAVVRVVRENAFGVRVIKALSKGDYEKARFDKVNRAAADAEVAAGKKVAMSDPIIKLLLNTGLTLVVAVGAMRVQRGAMQPGAIIAFLSYFTIILNSTLMLTRVFVNCSKGAASARRISEVLSAPDDMPVREDDGLGDPAKHIEFDRVTFSYNGVRNEAEDISFSLEKGQTLGIFGPTGSGKTTLISLLMRFYDPDSGVVRINRRRVDSIPLRELRSMFGAVFQNDVLFMDSIEGNISFLRDIPHEGVERAARTAMAHGFISAMPEGYASQVDIRGANLSGGQKQRILISRALAGESEILILDDAQSALDYATDAALRTAIARDHGSATLIIISERVSSLMHADKILVLDGGRISALGTHAELMGSCPEYADIARVQMGGNI